ncbi:MAG: hypothetical protein NWQ38_09100 [Cellulophaga sp.]|nr:hypothetical protein [Cellulophaga sp.]
MKIINKFFLLVIVSTVIFSCDRDNEGPTFTPPENISDILVQDEAKLQAYFETHFYNYEEFENPQPNFDYKIVIDTIAGDNSNKISLKNSPSFGFKTIDVNSEQFGATKVESIEHKVYYIIARQGVGESTTFADSTYVNYEGSLLDGSIFDSSSAPIWFDLATNIPGFSLGITSLKGGDGYTENADGTINIENYGIGAIFIPSALAYYSDSSRSTIPAYSPLIFKLDLYAVSQIDHDRDGIPSFMEDLNGNGNLNDDNTNAEEERKAFTGQIQTVFANFRDADDDGDGTPTSEEIIINDDGTITFPDTDGDGIADYLDRDTK